MMALQCNAAMRQECAEPHRCGWRAGRLLHDDRLLNVSKGIVLSRVHGVSRRCFKDGGAAMQHCAERKRVTTQRCRWRAGRLLHNATRWHESPIDYSWPV